MKKDFCNRMISLLLVCSMLVGTASIMTACGSSGKDQGKESVTEKDGPVTLTVYSQLSSYSGLQTGWMADVLKDQFDVEINIVPDMDDVFKTKKDNQAPGDVFIFGGNMDQYASAIKKGLLYDLEQGDLIQTKGAYIYENMPDAIRTNKELTASLTGDEDNKTLYGWGDGVATSAKSHQNFFYTWDTRWDLYQEMGYPKVKDLRDLAALLKKMQAVDPKDDSGNKTYAVSLWPEWDEEMVMYAKSTAVAYYGYDQMNMGLYNPKTGEYYDALMEDGPYIEMLKWYNGLYRDGLLDPDSRTQTYDQMAEKVKDGGVLFSIFNYSGQLAFNSKKHMKKGEYMYCMKPTEASPIVYGMSTLGSNYITTIGAKSEYPELCMEILNYFCTPEGRMTYLYGPKDECWYYDDEGYCALTELGEACKRDKKTVMEKHQGTFGDGELQMAVSTWSVDADNTESNGDTYNYDNWHNNQVEPKYKIQKDWVNKTGCKNLNDYMEQGKFTVSPGTSFSATPKEDAFATVFSQIQDSIKNNSWNAIYAKNDAQFNAAVSKMKKETEGYGYAEALEWCKKEAERRKGLEDALAK